jgi:hypothetical protein
MTGCLRSKSDTLYIEEVGKMMEQVFGHVDSRDAWIHFHHAKPTASIQ